MNLKFNNNDNKRILQFEIEDASPIQQPILAMIYYPSVDAPLSLFQLIKANLFLGLTNFGTVKAKELRLFRYFVEDNKYITENTYNNLYQLCELIPGATLIQMILSINLIKTKSFFLSLIGLLFFTLPGIITVSLISYAFYYYNDYFIIVIDSPWYYKAVIYLQISLSQAGIALLLNFSFEQMKSVFQSNFQMGLIIINTVVLFLTNSFLTLVILLFISGYLCMKNKESEFLIEKVSSDIVKTITHDSYWSFLGLPCLVLYFTILIILLILAYYVFDNCLVYVKLYVLGSSVFIDYTSLNFLCVLFNFTPETLLSSFGLMSIFQGHIFNIIGALFIIQRSSLYITSMEIISCYLPSLLILGFFIQIFPLLNECPDIQFMMKGMKTASIGFIISFLPKIWYYSCKSNIYYHWILSSLIILIGSYCFYKQKMIIGFIVIIGLSMICSFICS